MKKHLRKYNSCLSNLMFDIIECNKFLIDEFPFLANHLKTYERRSHLRSNKPTNFFELSILMDKVPRVIKSISNNKGKFKMPSSIDSNAKTYIHNIGEGFTDDEYFFAIHEMIELFELKPPIIFSNSSMNCDRLYDKFIKKNNLAKKFEVELSLLDFGNKFVKIEDIFIYGYNKEINYDYTSLSKKKLFCNFNMKARPHRSAMISLLNYYDLLKENYVTTPSVGLGRERVDIEWQYLLKHSACFLQNLSNSDQIIEKLFQIKDIYPLRIDNRSQHSNISQGLCDPLIYNARVDSLFEVISETLISESHFFTEKTYMPIALCKPFILISSFESLKALRTLGYQSFHPYINEEYDIIEDDAERCIAICEELCRLKKVRDENPDKFYSDFMKMLEICRKNKKVFLKK